MGFLDKAKAAATDLAAKADTALASAGAAGPRPADADALFRDLGVLTYLEASGRPADAVERDRVLTALRTLDDAGSIRSYSALPSLGSKTARTSRGHHAAMIRTAVASS